MALFLTLNEEELTSFHDRYRNNDLFRHWSPILCQLERECGGRDAISIWACSEQCLNRLRQVSQYRETEIDYILRQLLQETDVMTAVTVMCVVLIRLMNAVEKGHEDDTFNNEPMCIAIMSVMMNNRVYKPIYDAITNNFFGRKNGFDGRPVVIQPSDPMNETIIEHDLTKENMEQSSKTKLLDTDTDDAQMSEDYKPTYINEQHNNNCQQFFGPISNCTFMMPVATPSPKRKPKATKPKKKAAPKPMTGAKPMTLKYFRHGNKGYLRKQKERVKLVFRKWNEWGWISSEVTTDDFDALFEGTPRHCNIDWKRNSTILSMLMRDLLEYQNRHGENMIEKQTGQSATSMVEQQFGKTANFDEKRLTDDDKFKIHLTIYLLDPGNPLPQRKGGGDEDYDLSDSAMLELLAGHLRSTKGI